MIRPAAPAIDAGLFILLTVLPAILGFLLLATSRGKPGRRVLGITLIVAGVFVVFALHTIRGRYVAERIQPASRVVAPGNPSDEVWARPPQEGAFPEWVKDAQLFAPAFESSPIGNTSYVKQDGKGRLAGYSGLAPGPEEARAQAWQALAERLRGLVLAGCAVKAPSRIEGVGSIRLLPIVDETIALRRPALSKETYEDAIALDYGTVHRAAVVVEAPPALIDELSKAALANLETVYREHQAAELKRTTTMVYSGGGALFLLLVILAIYLFLNAHTKGYYAMPLRLAAAGLYAASIFTLLKLLRVYPPT